MNNEERMSWEERFDEIGVDGRLGAYLNTVVDDLDIDNKGQYFRDLFGKYDVELKNFIRQLALSEREAGRREERDRIDAVLEETELFIEANTDRFKGYKAVIRLIRARAGLTQQKEQE